MVDISAIKYYNLDRYLKSSLYLNERDEKMKFNEKLIKLRKASGLSQEELGNKLNVARQTVSKWELGDTDPEMEKLIELSNLFNVSIDELVKEKEIPEVIARELDHKKIESVYTDVGKAKKCIKWYLIIAGSVAVIVILLILYFFIRTILS